MQPLVSVIVPIYKVEEYLEQCVDSIINQSYKNLEIILIDDGSPDNCGKICDKYADMDSRIKVIHKSNGGLSDARNVGINIAKGDYLVFVDSDDWINKYMIEKLLDLAINKDLDIVECKFKEVYDRNSVMDESKIGEVKVFNNKEALENHFNGQGLYRCVWNKLYKKYVFNEIRFPKGKLAEDLHTTYKLFFKANKVGLVDFIGYYYYIRPNSIIGQGGVELFISTYEGIKSQNDFIEKNLYELKPKVNNIYFKTLIKTDAFLRNYKGNKDINYYKEEVNKELQRKDIKVSGTLNLAKISYRIAPVISSNIVQKFINEKGR